MSSTQAAPDVYSLAGFSRRYHVWAFQIMFASGPQQVVSVMSLNLPCKQSGSEKSFGEVNVK